MFTGKTYIHRQDGQHSLCPRSGYANRAAALLFQRDIPATPASAVLLPNPESIADDVKCNMYCNMSAGRPLGRRYPISWTNSSYPARPMSA